MRFCRWAQVLCSFSEMGTLALRPQGQGESVLQPSMQEAGPQPPCSARLRAAGLCPVHSASSLQLRVRLMADLEAMASGGPGKTAVPVPNSR